MQSNINKPNTTHSMLTALAQANNGNIPEFVGLAFSRNLGPDRYEVPPANQNANINGAGIAFDAGKCFPKS